MAPILDVLKIFSEVVVASKCGLLARIEKQAITKTGPAQKFL